MQTGHEKKTDVGSATRAALGIGLMALFLLAFSSTALAAPTHPRLAAQDITNLNHACGAAVDNKGDVYASSAGESKVKIFSSSHTEIGSISDVHEPCGLAVNAKGELFVAEKGTGEVVRFKPNAYPFSGTPSYGSREAIDSSGAAKGISIDPYDSRLYVAEGNRIAVFNPDGTLDALDEVQTISGLGTGGTYKLSFQGQQTGAIAWDATPAQVQTALEGLSTIGAGNVDVQADGPSRDVTFTGALAGADQEALQGDGSGLTGGTFFSIQETVKGFDGYLGEGQLSGATGVAAYTYLVNKGCCDESFTRYLFVADAATDQLKLFSVYVRTQPPASPAFAQPKLQTTLNGPKAGEDFGFGAAGAYLAVDPGNGDATGKCASVAAQACTAGHLFVYDDAHTAVDEFDASGEFLDRFTAAGLADAKPTAIAIDRSGGPGDGTLYLTAGAGSGAGLLAFAPLPTPSRALLPSPLSRALASANVVTTDSHGDVYVRTGAKIHVYSPAGAEIAVGAGTGIEDANTVKDLAVDSTGKLYVVDVDNSNHTAATYYTPSAYPPLAGTTYTRHQPAIATDADFPANNNILQAIAVNPKNDHVFVATGAYIHEYDSAANGSTLLNDHWGEGRIPGVFSLAVDGATGNVYIGSNPTKVTILNAAGTEVLAQINGAGSPSGKFPGGNAVVAVDQANGHLLEFNSLAPAREYDAAGGFVAEFAGLNNSNGDIAIDSSCALHDPPLDGSTTPTCAQFDPGNGNVYVATITSTPGGNNLTAFGPLTYGAPPLALTGTAAGLGAGNATFGGAVDPRGFSLSDCHFEYLTDAAYLAAGFTDLSSGGSTPCAESLAAIGSGNGEVGVHADLAGLDPDGRYRFRLVAANKYGPGEGDPALFGPPAITAKTALPVLYDEATLRAGLDPAGLPTDYHFEYVGDADYQLDGFARAQSTPVESLSGGASPTDVDASLAGLAEATTYHFRLVASNQAKTVTGPERTFTTLARPAPQSCPNTEFRTGLSANLPDCRAYELVTPAETNGFTPFAANVGSFGAPDAGFNNWLTPPRGPLAGERLAYFTGGTLPGFDGNGVLDGYRAQRGEGEHPQAGWTSELFSPTYRQSVPDFSHGINQKSVASDQLYSFWTVSPAESLPGTLAAGAYLRTAGEAAASACNPEPSQGDFELTGCGSLGTDPQATGHYIAPGGAHVVFSSKAHLEGDAAPAGTEALYERAAGSAAAQVLSLKPDGSAFGAGEDATYVGATDDGSAVLFRAGGALYLRRGAETTEVATAPNSFAGVSPDGTRVFYAATASNAPATLYRCDAGAGGPCAGAGAHAPTQIAANSIFVNVSDDGSHVIFSSKDALTGAEQNDAGQTAEAGKPNLYSWNGATTGFVAVLDSTDFDGGGGFGANANVDLGEWVGAINPHAGFGRALSPTRAAPDGEVFVFQSHAQLTTYDNGGEGEIYRFDPAAAPGERLLCVSCDPGGAPPSADAMLADINNGVDTTTQLANLSDDGSEVFFQSPDRLLPEDANDAVDVYEWKAAGAGAPACGRPSGCLSLISSGQGESDSLLYSITADGHDVFFSTREKLVGTDVSGSPSIYDARVAGGIPDPPNPAPCQGDACQGQGGAPPALPNPASGGSGGGNVTPPARKKHHHKKRRHHRKRHAHQAKRHHRNGRAGR